MKSLNLYVLGAFALSTFFSPPVAAENEPLEGLSQWIEQGQEDWNIPGMAVAVVQNDEIIHMRGYGTLKLGENMPVNADSLFGVASTTKAMTVAILGMLVDEGKLSWDDRVIDHLPWFRLNDPWVTREVRVRDLLTHQVGVGRMTGNRLQFMPTSDRRTVIEQMAYHEPEAPFRSRYVYSNVMYSVAGEIAAEITGQSWESLIHERLFKPLTMTRSNTSITEFADSDHNIAWPHQFIDGEQTVIQRRNFDNVGPSASVNTTVNDMAQWMRLQLGEPGVYDGERLLSAEVMQEMHQPQIATGRSDRESTVNAYGFGWSLGHYEGYSVSSHGGATDGFNTSLTLIPELDLGIVIVTNTFNTYRVAVERTIIDRIAGLPDRDWHNEIMQRYEARFADVQARRDDIHDARKQGTSPSFNKEAMTGTYFDPHYGEVEVFINDAGELALHFWNDSTTLLDLEHWHHDTWRASYRNQAQREKFVWFTSDGEGNPQHLNVRWTLRPELLQVGIYPTSYYRDVEFVRQ